MPLVAPLHAPATAVCPYCKLAGFVRFETVLTRGQIYKHYYCGACDRPWQIDASDPPTPPDPPDAPRSRPLGRS